MSFSVGAGECFAVLGRNGSGKSTLVRLLAGLEKASSGSLDVLGIDLMDDSRQHLSMMGVSLDTDIHWDQLSGRENAFFTARSHKMDGRGIDRRLKELFELADLSPQADEPVKTYSFGMRRKLSLIQALCHDPDLLLLDEPTTGLDMHFLPRLADTVKARSKAGKTTWVSGNDAEWISDVATRVAFMASGQIITHGTIGELLEEVSETQEVLIKLSQINEVPNPVMEGLQSFKQEGKTINAVLKNDPALVPKTIDWIVSKGGIVKRIEVKQGSLRDVFLLKTGQLLEE